MAKVTHPLLSGDVSGKFGNKMIFKRGGIVTRMFWPRNPRTAAQQRQRELFKEFSMPSLTQEQADLLYSAILHLHDDKYSSLSHLHDHGGLTGLSDDDHTQYFDQTRGDARYLQTVPQQDHGGLAGLSDDDHAQYFDQTRGDSRYLQDAPNDGKNYVRKSATWGEVVGSSWTTQKVTAAQTYTDSPTLQPLTPFSFTMLASKRYVIRSTILYYTVAAADFKFQLSFGTGYETITKRSHIVPAGTAVVNAIDITTPPVVTILSAVDGYGFIEFVSSVRTGAANTSFGFWFAQNVSNANTLMFIPGSFIEYSYS